MIAWILLIASTLGLTALFVRRLLKTKRDMVFQHHLKKEEEEASEMESEEVLPDLEDEEKKKASNSTVRRHFSKGELHVGRKEFEDAEVCFLAVIESDENHIEALHQLGMICLKRSDFPKAELYFSKLVNLKKDPVYFSNLGAALYQQQRLLEAAEAYENAITMDDRRANRLQSLAQVYHELGDHDKALKYFELAARRKPKDLNLKLILAQYYTQLDRIDEARDAYKKILEADPYNKEVKGLLKGLKKS